MLFKYRQLAIGIKYKNLPCFMDILSHYMYFYWKIAAFTAIPLWAIELSRYNVVADPAMRLTWCRPFI